MASKGLYAATKKEKKEITWRRLTNDQVRLSSARETKTPRLRLSRADSAAFESTWKV